MIQVFDLKSKTKIQPYTAHVSMVVRVGSQRYVPGTHLPGVQAVAVAPRKVTK